MIQGTDPRKLLFCPWQAAAHCCLQKNDRLNYKENESALLDGAKGGQNMGKWSCISHKSLSARSSSSSSSWLSSSITQRSELSRCWGSDGQGQKRHVVLLMQLPEDQSERSGWAQRLVVRLRTPRLYSSTTVVVVACVLQLLKVNFLST